MNIENLNKLIYAVGDGLPSVAFSMDYYLIHTAYSNVAPENPCGTAACLAGHCYLLKHADRTPSALADDVEWERVSNFDLLDEAAAWLGITQRQGSELFFAQQMVYEHQIPMAKISRESSLRTLLHLKQTGEVKWFKPGEE